MTCLRLGLTGGIGSGKTTVAHMLATCGAAVLDADAISRELTAPGGAAIEPIQAHFGPHLIAADGALNRDAMRQLVFSQPQARRELEAIIHPLVGRTLHDRAQHAAHQGHAMVVFDIPLLAESGHWPARLDRVVVVDCLPETQVQRVVARNQLSPEAVRAIMAAQAPRLQRLDVADAVIFNDGCSLDQLQAQIGELARQFGL